MNIVRITFLICCCLTFSILGIFRTNLFEPYDILLIPRVAPQTCCDISATYESTVSIKGVQSEENELEESTFSKKVNVLQLFQSKQDALAALKGTCSTNDASLLAELFPVNDDNGVHGNYCFTGHLRAHNIMLAARYYFPHNINLGLYVPFIQLKLTDIVAKELIPLGKDTTREDIVANNLLCNIAQLGNLNFNGWTRTGIGDITLLAWWQQHYLQDKIWLRDVHIGLRGGLTFPTGKKQNEDIILGIPFGFDAGIGLLFGSTLELWFNHNFHMGIDAQFLAHFGTTKLRRIKTDPAQTDFMFLTKLQTFKNPGFNQHFTLFAEFAPLVQRFSTRIAYQFTKHSEDKIFFCSDCFSSAIANETESLLEWTTHSIILQLFYDFTDKNDPYRTWNASLSGFVKTGINGSRAILANTLGLSFDISF